MPPGASHDADISPRSASHPAIRTQRATLAAEHVGNATGSLALPRTTNWGDLTPAGEWKSPQSALSRAKRRRAG